MSVKERLHTECPFFRCLQIKEKIKMAITLKDRKAEGFYLFVLG